MSELPTTDKIIERSNKTSFLCDGYSNLCAVYTNTAVTKNHIGEHRNNPRKYFLTASVALASIIQTERDVEILSNSIVLRQGKQFAKKSY